MPQVLERFLMSKSADPHGGEDRLIEAENRYFGVVDGATDHSGLNWGTTERPQTGGMALADIVQRVFETASADASPAVLAQRINNEIRSAAARANIDLSDMHHRASAAFAVYAVSANAIYHIGDCSFGFVLPDGRFEVHCHDKKIDEFTSDLRVAVVRFLQRQGCDPFAGGQDRGRDFIQPFLLRQSELQNARPDDSTDWCGLPRGMLAYKCLNGADIALDVTPVPAEARKIVLASDGFKTLRPNCDETLRELSRLLSADPHCLAELKSTKGLAPNNKNYDDMSYLRVAT